jgi:hypothetical protein
LGDIPIQHLLDQMVVVAVQSEFRDAVFISRSMHWRSEARRL